MSFTNDIKQKLYSKNGECEFCKTAMLSGLIRYSATISSDSLQFSTESEALAVFTQNLLSSAISLDEDISLYESASLYTIDLVGTNFQIATAELCLDSDINEITPLECCKKSYLLGVFLGGGSISNPNKSYHLELTTKSLIYANEAVTVLELFGIKAKITKRKNKFSVYIKDFESITSFLGLIGADFAALDLFEASVVKEIRNGVNRQVNCENANLRKASKAAGEQLVAIKKIKSTIGFDTLSPALREIAHLRLEYPDEDLKSLGERLVPTLGKSGVNHRLKRIIEIAKEL